ncbi:hypothetical protein M670_03613 [Schinkia azotoformans MEV2011]|uniref:N-acetyltransferase domain-containing protein n=1 Tax=Schinkia azotoformans MEV2011 TaxID=1348973 RepID=A0A072NI79_SCHAZ|nr:hypothetical protein M670_03613 [Schinkia azotoformans MEV2011]
MFTFIFTYLEKDYVDELLDLDKKVYNSEYQVNKETTLHRLDINPLTDLTVVNNDDLVGYLTVCPVDDDTYKGIIEHSVTEEEIEQHTLPYDKRGFYNLYLSSIVIDKEKYPYYSGKYLFAFLEKHLHKLRKQGFFVNKILAFAVSIAGRKTLIRFGFKEIKNNVFEFSCIKQGIYFIKRNFKLPKVISTILNEQKFIFKRGFV